MVFTKLLKLECYNVTSFFYTFLYQFINGNELCINLLILYLEFNDLKELDRARKQMDKPIILIVNNQ